MTRQTSFVVVSFSVIESDDVLSSKGGYNFILFKICMSMHGLSIALNPKFYFHKVCLIRNRLSYRKFSRNSRLLS